MGILGSLLSAAVKVAISPIAIAADVIDVVHGDQPTATKEVLGSALEDVKQGLDELV